jgi:sorting nexin-25
MRGLVEGILELVLEESERKSRAVMIIAREIVACAVLMPVVEMMSDPDFWNKILDEQVSEVTSLFTSCAQGAHIPSFLLQAGNYIRQQKLVSQLRSALDQTITGPPSSSSPHRREASLPLQPLDPNSRSIPSTTTPLPSCPAKPSISSKTSSKSFESFVRGIGRMDSLMDLRRLRNDLGGEIRKTKGILESLHQQQQASSASSTPAIPNERRPEVLRAHLERLYEARAKAESRIAQLSTDNSSSSSTLTSPLKSTRKFSSAIRTDTKLSSVTPSPSHKLSLREVLVNPGTLGYFLEFMERRGGMLLVQFWLIVEGFKDPLEGDVAAEWKGNEAQSAAEAVEKGEGEEAVQTAREDMRAVWEGYFEADLLGDEVVDRYGADVRSFVEGRGEKGLAQARKRYDLVFSPWLSRIHVCLMLKKPLLLSVSSSLSDSSTLNSWKTTSRRSRTPISTSKPCPAPLPSHRCPQRLDYQRPPSLLSPPLSLIARLLLFPPPTSSVQRHLPS